MHILFQWILNALIFLLVAEVVPGISIKSFWTALILALLWSIISVTLKPMLLILTLPINLLTLGLFTFVINAFFLILLSSFVRGFEVSGFVTALLGAFVLSVSHWIIHVISRRFE